MSNKAFITGSHAYGHPDDFSDVDLVVRIKRADSQKLCALLRPYLQGVDIKRSGYAVFRIGPLNLLVCADARDYRIWETVTEDLKRVGPVTKDQACEAFDRMRWAEGINPEDYNRVYHGEERSAANVNPF